MERHEQQDATVRATRAELPLVYSCSGCSSAAQLTNGLAIRLDRERLAEMSCIAGVGGGVKPLVKKALSGRPILALDGCPLHCVQSCLASHGVTPSVHVDLSEHGVKKRLHVDPSADEVTAIWEGVVRPAAERLREPTLGA
ncbi:MAG: putative zinc-binding protein [Deltaproteobacteria bacterium]|nr:putative zinc-binding protein [Deltaproteobacteria bacterium]